jgi:hypothetical protein
MKVRSSEISWDDIAERYKEIFEASLR